MYVSYTSSNEYAAITGISIYSLLKNNMHVKELAIFLLDLGIDEENKKKINGIVSSFNRKIRYIQIENDTILNYLGVNVPAHYGSLATYARLCAPVLYPPEVHRIIYIDSDMVINGSLDELYSLDLKEKIVAAVPAVFDLAVIAGDSLEERAIANKHELYVNGGLLLIDIDNWKRNSFEIAIRRSALLMKEFCHKDQSILNNALDDEYLQRLPCKYNFMLHYLPKYLISTWANNSSPLTKEEILEAADYPIVVHYAGDQSRPWFKENTSFLSKLYHDYKKECCFCDQPTISLFSTKKFEKTGKVGLLFANLLYKLYQKPIGYPLYFISRVRVKLRANRRN